VNNRCTRWFPKLTADHGDNNQKLMIVSKTNGHFGEQYCLVKVAFFIEVSNTIGCFILLENTNLFGQ
jgi:hypothetical protein